MLLTLPHEIIIEVIGFASPESQIMLRQTCKYLAELVDLLPRTDSMIDALKRNALVSIVHLMKTTTYTPADWNHELYFAASHGYLSIVKLAISKGATDIEIGLMGACYGGHMDIFNMMIDLGANNWTCALHNACLSCANIDIINILIDKVVDLDSAFAAACGSGNMHVVQMMIDRGADDWKDALYLACYFGREHIVEFLIDKGADCWDVALLGVCNSDNLLLAQLILSKKTYSDEELIVGLQSACLSGNLSMIKLIAATIANPSAIRWHNVLYDACSGGNMDVVGFIIDKANLGIHNWDSGLIAACHRGCLPMVQLMIDKGACNWNDALRAACVNGNMDIIHLIISKGANDWDGALLCAIQGSKLDVIKFIINKVTHIGSDVGEHSRPEIREYIAYARSHMQN